MNSEQPLHQFKVILNPKGFYIFGPKKATLLFLDKYLILKKRRNPLRIPYASIESIYMEEGKAFLKWGDETLSFGIASYISPSTFDVSLTTQVVNLILQHKSGGAICPEAYPELTLKKVAADKRKLFIKTLLLLIPLIVLLTLLFDTLLRKPWLFPVIVIPYWVLVALISTKKHPTLKHIMRANSYASRGYFSSATEEIDKALRISPNSLEVRFNLAWIYYLKRDFLSAQVECQKILELNPDYEPAKKLLDMIGAHSSP